jgi:hypothetical protein
MYLALFFAVVGLVAVWHFRRQPGAGLSSSSRGASKPSAFQFSKNMRAVLSPKLLGEILYAERMGETPQESGAEVLAYLNKLSKAEITGLLQAAALRARVPSGTKDAYNTGSTASWILVFAFNSMQQCDVKNALSGCILSNPPYGLSPAAVKIITPAVLWEAYKGIGQLQWGPRTAATVRGWSISKIRKVADLIAKQVAKSKNPIHEKAKKWWSILWEDPQAVRALVG